MNLENAVKTIIDDYVTLGVAFNLYDVYNSCSIFNISATFDQVNSIVKNLYKSGDIRCDRYRVAAPGSNRLFSIFIPKKDQPRIAPAGDKGNAPWDQDPDKSDTGPKVYTNKTEVTPMWKATSDYRGNVCLPKSFVSKISSKNRKVWAFPNDQGTAIIVRGKAPTTHDAQSYTVDHYGNVRLGPGLLEKIGAKTRNGANKPFKITENNGSIVVQKG